MKHTIELKEDGFVFNPFVASGNDELDEKEVVGSNFVARIENEAGVWRNLSFNYENNLKGLFHGHGMFLYTGERPKRVLVQAKEYVPTAPVKMKRVPSVVKLPPHYASNSGWNNDDDDPMFYSVLS